VTRSLSTVAGAGAFPGPYELALDPSASTLATAALEPLTWNLVTSSIGERNFGPGDLPLIFSSFHATYGATEAEARRLVQERLEAIDYERDQALVADMRGGGVDLSAADLDKPLPEHDFVVNGCSRRSANSAS
jgi:hypothetical protein